MKAMSPMLIFIGVLSFFALLYATDFPVDASLFAVLGRFLERELFFFY